MSLIWTILNWITFNCFRGTILLKLCLFLVEVGWPWCIGRTNYPWVGTDYPSHWLNNRSCWQWTVWYCRFGRLHGFFGNTKTIVCIMKAPQYISSNKYRNNWGVKNRTKSASMMIKIPIWILIWKNFI